MPTVPTLAPASHGWQPAGAHEKLGERYMFHEPGETLRSNLIVLDEWRRTARVGRANLRSLSRSRARR